MVLWRPSFSWRWEGRPLGDALNANYGATFFLEVIRSVSPSQPEMFRYSCSIQNYTQGAKNTAKTASLTGGIFFAVLGCSARKEPRLSKKILLIEDHPEMRQ